MIVFWHHVGREHGVNGYGADIRKNEEEIIQKTILNKMENAKKSHHRFIKHDEDTLIELPSQGSEDKFIVIYCISKGLQFSFGMKKKYPYWLIDIVEIEEIKQDVYCVHDLFIDIPLQKDGRYEVLDLDDFHWALQQGVIDQETALKALASFSGIIEELNQKAFPNSFIDELTKKYVE